MVEPFLVLIHGYDTILTSKYLSTYLRKAKHNDMLSSLHSRHRHIITYLIHILHKTTLLLKLKKKFYTA